MSTREHSVRTGNSVNTSGSLKDVLREHAYERCRHFFLYVFTVKALTDYVNATHAANLGPTDALYVNATHQVDTGLRSADVEYYGFDAKDPNVVNQSATSCVRMDAAHFCNLGVTHTCQSAFGRLAGDPVVSHLFEALKTICGNTRQLPQRVNIGPDKIIDKFHGELATTILGSGKAPVSLTRLQEYLTGADKAMKEYEDKQSASGNHGVVACVQAYRASYASDFESLWKQISDNVIGDCIALKLDKDAYVSWL